MARQNTLVRVRLDGDSSGGIGVPSNNSLQRTRPGRGFRSIIGLPGR